ncbi:Hsp20 family protein [Fulvivirga sp. M361]|uniref:Hsp20 family protein n=1 Tax=Fulvivirga sp. M361 TaxID=2594266 RepID=UPI00117A96E7|nr:Hsp20 family protein [Fulvivirga sp. M361]TRX47313.1 Hsp20 family protein [Fulvivirga sp. M361]
MRYDKDKNWVEMVLRNADVMNTLNGGMSQAKVSIRKEEDHFLITTTAPGVNPDLFKVEVVGQNILLYHMVQFNSSNNGLAIPRVLTSIPISMEMDYEKITAQVENGLLKVIVPFNEPFNGYHKPIDIKRA